MTAIERPRTDNADIGGNAADCCDASAFASFVTDATGPQSVPADTLPLTDPTAFVCHGDDGIDRLNLLVENLQCAACIGKIESRLRSYDGVTEARVNMSTRRMTVAWHAGQEDPAEMMRSVASLGYPVAPFDPADAAKGIEKEEKQLLSALAVSGFAAGNVMLLSVAIWSGHAGGMGEGTRTLFHWISALIALPAIVYAGQPFFRSAIASVRAQQLNMDVPISLAVILASGMSIQQTMQNAHHAYFDAAIMLLFFLLIGRYLDQRARNKARSAATHLLGLQANAATIIDAQGIRRAVRLGDVHKGMTVLVAQGERIPVDGDVQTGTSEIDTALITGESLPKLARPGDQVFAGTLNLSAPLTLTATAVAEGTLLSEIVRLMEVAEQGRARYVRLADRVAKIYSPVVHILAAVTFIGWLLLTNVGWEPSLMVAIAVLIITCPCALGLAVPTVQVVASGRLLKAGVLVKSPDALERLASIDTVVFDKTGTLTRGHPELVGGTYQPTDLILACSLADHSRHPLSQALVRASTDPKRDDVKDVQEVPGRGIEAMLNGERIRLGSRNWCGIEHEAAWSEGPEIWLSRTGCAPVCFKFRDSLRSDAIDVIGTLQKQAVHIELLSGDTPEAVEPIAKACGIEAWRSGCMPGDKTDRLEALANDGRTVLMIGDGLNDAPSLVAAHVSMSPVNAADVSQTAADLVFQGATLRPVLTAMSVARSATRLVKQNFALAFGYNAIAVPIAVLGFVTPLIAAIAMSSSSIVVTVNALRLRLIK